MLLKIICIGFLGLQLARAACREAHQNNFKTPGMTLQVYHYKVPCVGESVQLCYKVKRENGKTELFYDPIEGFDYAWGYTYSIIVERTSRQTAPADASTFRYTLK